MASDCRGIDVVSDFDDSGNDRIDLSGPFSGTPIYRGTGAFNGTHQVHIKDIAGPDVLVEINLSGSAAPEVRTHLAGSKTASDVIL